MLTRAHRCPTTVRNTREVRHSRPFTWGRPHGAIRDRSQHRHDVVIFAADDSGSDVLDPGSLTNVDWLRAGAILVGALLLAIIVSRVLRRLFSHGIGHGFAAIITARLVGYAIFLVGLFYALTTLGVRVGPLIGALGLSGLVLALALQTPVENLVASVILQSRRPFSIGDTVDLDGTRGIVVDIDSRTTRLSGLDGTQIRLPNSAVLSSSIINLTREPVRRSSLTVGVAYDTDLQRSAEVLAEAVARVPRVLAEPAPTVNLDGFGDSSIEFTLLYWHNSDVPSELAARNDLVLAVHQALSTQGITIAFPQMVVWSGKADEPAYTSMLERVHRPYPGLEDSASTAKRRSTWRRSNRRPDID